MTRLALLGVAALLSAAAAMPATAQEVISNPGYCAQFYPNANCQNKGANNPYTGDYQLRNPMRGAPVPARRAPSTMSAAAAAVTHAIDCEKYCQRLAPVAQAAGAIPWKSLLP